MNFEKAAPLRKSHVKVAASGQPTSERQPWSWYNLKEGEIHKCNTHNGYQQNGVQLSRILILQTTISVTDSHRLS